MMIKNFVFYAFSTFINEYAAKEGPGHMCKVFGIVTLCGFTTCVPMCEYYLPEERGGKRGKGSGVWNCANNWQMCLAR